MKNRLHMSHIVERIPRWRIFVFLILAAMTADAKQQQLQTRRREQRSSFPKALPSVLQHQMQALGTRTQTADKEETELDAQFTDDVGNKKSIHIVYQESGLIRIDGVHDKRAVTFDGELTHGVADRMDESLVETFVLDTPEGMFHSVRKGASMILLGHNVQSNSGTESDFKGPGYDVYLVTAPDRIRGANTLQSRRFYFDSGTGLLASTRYSGPSGMTVETRFFNWGHVDGSAYPTSVERYENGRLTFSITTTRVIGQPQRNAAAFR